jgi:anti-sigma regulatory factor (Ser/Thr protein kinase)
MADNSGNCFELSAAANVGGLATCRSAMEKSPVYRRLPDHLRFFADLALDELATNAVKYGGGLDSEFSFQLNYSHGLLRIDYTDHGVPFDPWARAAPDRPDEPVPDSVEDLRIGGRGLMMMMKLSSSRGYRRIGDTNQVTLSVRETPEK